MRTWWPLALFALIPCVSRADGRTTTGVCNERQATAVGQIACELAQTLRAGSQPLRVVVREVTSAAAIEHRAELARRLAAALAGQLGPNARVADPTLDERALERTPRSDATVVLAIELSRDRFSVNAELYAGAPGFWERFRPSRPGAALRAQAARPIDAELAGYLPPVKLVLTRIDKARIDEPSVALACGDLDGDGAIEIVSVGRRRIQVGRIRGGSFEAQLSRGWAELSEVAPRPLREPLATASIVAPNVFRVGITDRADGLELDARLGPVARYAGLVPTWLGACASVVFNGLSSEQSACEKKPNPKASAGSIDALAGARVVRRDGSASEVRLSRQPNAELEIDVAGKRVPFDDKVGTSLAVGDLDGDGQPELITTLDTLDPSGDAVVVRTLTNDGKLVEAFRASVPGGVRAVAVCPSEGDLLKPIVIATGDGLWIAR